MPSNQTNINIGVKYNVDQSSVNAVKKSLQDLQNIKVKDFSGTKTQLDEIKQTARQVQAALDAAFNVNLNSLNVSTFNQQLRTAGLSVDQIYQKFSGAGAQGQVAFSKMASSVLTTNLQLKQTKSLMTSMGETMMNTVKWGIASSVMNNFTNSVRQAFQYAQSLDGALTDIRIVTGDSTEQMRQFAKQANSAAQNLGRSTMDYTKAALTFYQQGLSDEEVQTRTQTVLKAQNITGAGQEMADYLTAVWNGYKVANQEAELYVDKLAAVADSSASNMSQLAIAMSKVASSANALGVPVDNLNAQIATIVATTRQAPESVGNALKTIYSRINDIATGADDAQVSLGNYSSKMLDVGISVLDANGNLRDTGDVIDEIGGKWQTLSREQQIYLARTMAGQRQYNNLIALFDNWSKYTDLVNVSMEAQGTTMQKNARYMDSLGAKMEQFGAASERVKDALINEESLKGLVSTGTTLVNLVGNFVEAIGGGGNALLLLGSSLTTLFSGVISKEINNIVTNMQNVKNNALKIKQDIQNTKLFGQSQGYRDGTITAMVDAKKAAQQYYGFMTDAQKNEYNGIVEQIGAQQDKLTILNEQIQAANNFEKALKGGLSAAVDEKDALQEMLSNFSGKGGLGQLRDSDQFNALKTQIDDLSKIVDTSAIPAFNQFKNAIAAIKDPAQATDQELRAVRTAAEQIASQTNTGIDLVLSLDQTQVKAKEAASALELAKKASEEYLQKVKQFANINGIVQSTAAIGRLASALSSLSNLKNIWSNQSLSDGQKFLQTIMNLGMAIPMLVSSISKLKTVTSAWSVSLGIGNKIQTAKIALTQAQSTTEAAHAKVIMLEAKALEYKKRVEAGQIGYKPLLLSTTNALTAARSAETAAIEAETIAQDQLNTSMLANPVGLAIAAGAAAIYAAVKIYDHFTMSVKQAEQAIKNFNEKQEQLNNNIKKYNSDQDTFLNSKEEWEELSRRAGAYNSTINNLTEEQKSRYYELSNLIAQYNSAAVIGYDQQGNAIIDINHNLEETIRLLKEKHQAEIESTYTSKEYKQAVEGQQVAYEKAVKQRNDLERESYLSGSYDPDQGGFTIKDQDKDAIEEANKKIAEKAKINYDWLIGQLSLDKNNNLYEKAKQSGGIALDAILRGYIEGLDIVALRQEYGSDIYQKIVDNINAQGGLLEQAINTLYTDKYIDNQGKNINLSQYILQQAGDFNEDDFSSLADKYSNATNIIAEIITNNSQLQEILEDEDNPLRQSILQFFEQAFNLDNVDWDGKEIKISDNAVERLRERINQAVISKMDLDGRGFYLDLNTLTAQLPENISDAQIDKIINKFNELYDGTKDWKDVLNQAQQSVAAMGSMDTFGLLNQFATGQIKKGSQEYQELQSKLNSLKDVYPQISNAVQILKTDWMQSTMTYQDALRDVNNLLLTTMQNSIASGDLTKEQVSSSLQNLVKDSETLQNALSKQLITVQDYQNVLGNLASQYESCQDELNHFAQALYYGDEQTVANATATLELSVRSAELAQRFSLNGDQIERVAAQLASENEYLAKNSELAADAAVRYIRLNTAVEDLYTNADSYRQILTHLGDGWTEFGEEFGHIRQIVADVFDTSADALGDDWISKNLESIIQMAEKGGQGLEQLRESAAEEILINTGIDTSGFDQATITAQEFFEHLNSLEDGAELSIDDQVFLQQLVTAMEAAGYSQEKIEDLLSGMNIDVDLVPYKQGLNEALDEAMGLSDANPIVVPQVDLGNYEQGLNATIDQAGEAGQLAADSFAGSSGVDVKTNTSNVIAPQQTIIPDQDMDVEYVRGVYSYPIINQTQGVFGPRLSVGSGTQPIAYPIFKPRTTTQTVEGSVQTAATGLQVIGPHKKSGGKVSHYNSPTARAGRSPSKGGGKKGGGGKGKGSTPKPATQAKVSSAKIQTKQKTPDINPYQQEQKSFDRQSKILDDLQDKQKKLVNRDRLKNLQQQNKTLEEQKKILEKELAISANAAAENSTANYANRLRQEFGKALKFDADGQISDINALNARNAAMYNAAAKSAADAFEKEKAAYNDYIQNTWNKYATQDQQNANKAEKERWDDRIKAAENAAKEQIKAAEETYKTRNDLINQYNKAWEEDQKRAEQIQKINDEIYEKRIEMSKIKVDLSIDTGEFERDWLEFENKVIKKLNDDDVLGNAKANFKELMSYFNSDQVKQTANQIKTIQEQIAIMEKGGTSNIYGSNLAQAKEDLEKYMKQQMDDLGNVQELIDDIKENYLDGLDDAKEKMDDQIDQYERVNDLIDHNVKLVQMLYGDKAYDTMNKYYDMQKANNEDALNSLRMQQQYWINLMANQTEGSDAWKAMKENLDDVTDHLNDKLEEMIQNLSDQWANKVDGIIARLNNGLTGGRGLDYLDEQWDFINDYDDNFLDTFESKMGIDEVTNLYQQAIDGLSGSPANQQKINKLMNDQLKILREKDHLTEYDIERAKAALEVQKARMALEDARYNKTKMRLRRDSQGNYTYQYVADEQKLSELQSALADAQANLYNTDKEHYTENLNKLYDTYKDYLEKMRDLTEEYNNTQDEEERARISNRIEMLKIATNNLMQGLTEDNKYTLQYLNESFFGGMGIDTSLMSAEQQMDIMIQNIPQMNSNIQDLANTIVGQGGILNATADAMKEINQATVEYDANVKEFLNDAGTSLQIVRNVTDTAGAALDQNIAQAQSLITQNQKLIDSCMAEVEALQELLDYMDKYMNKVMNISQLIENLRGAYNTGQNLNGSTLTADNIAVASNNLDTTTGMEYSGNPATDAKKVKAQIDALMAEYEKFLEQMSIATFDTGGATGSWGDASGRLAFLHQKELVLNETDTENILRAVQAVRMMTSIFSGAAAGDINSLTANSSGLLSGINTTEQLDQNVHIEANFPNVTQHTEIEQAFNNLVNMASMRAARYTD